MSKLPAFARVEDLAARRPGGVLEGDRPRAQAALDDASTLIRTEVGKDWVNETDPTKLAADVPAIFLTVACHAAKRAIDNPEGVQSEALAQGYSASYANSSSDVYLTKAETAKVRKGAGLSNVWTLPTTRDPEKLGLETASVVEGAGGEFLPVEPDGEPILWGGPDI